MAVETCNEHIAILFDVFVEGFWKEIRCLRKVSSFGENEIANLEIKVNEAMSQEPLVFRKDIVFLEMIPEIRSHLSAYVYNGGRVLKCLEKFCNALVYCDDFKLIALCFANNFYQ